jgi:hypothetical protein
VATLVDAVAEVFAFEALSGTTSSFTQGSSGRYIFGGAGWVGFGPLPDVNALKYGGPSGTDITPGGADVSFFFGNAALTAGSAVPGPSGTTTIYAAATAGLQGMAVGAAWEDVDSADDYTTNSGAAGDTNTALCTITVPNCLANQWVTGKFIAVSGNVTIDDFTVDGGETTEILDQDLDPGVTFAAVCAVRKQATANGSVTLQVRANSTSAAGTDALAWGATAERLIDAESGGATGTSATTNANDTSSASGTTTVTGTLARTNANDAASSSGTTTVVGSLARTNAADASTGSGTTTVTGTLARTNASDTSSAAGSAGSPTGTVAYTNNSDSATAFGSTPGPTTSGAPGMRRPWVAYINGKRVVGDIFEIQAMVEALAEEAAERDVAQAKPTKKPRIVVQPGKLVDIPKSENIPSISDTHGREIQENIRNIYHIAYARAKLISEQDEEDTLMVLL